MSSRFMPGGKGSLVRLVVPSLFCGVAVRVECWLLVVDVGAVRWLLESVVSTTKDVLLPLLLQTRDGGATDILLAFVIEGELSLVWPLEPFVILEGVVTLLLEEDVELLAILCWIICACASGWTTLRETLLAGATSAESTMVMTSLSLVAP